MFNSEYFKQIVELRNLDIPKAVLLRGLVISSQCIRDDEVQEKYIIEILTPVAAA